MKMKHGILANIYEEAIFIHIPKKPDVKNTGQLA